MFARQGGLTTDGVDEMTETTSVLWKFLDLHDGAPRSRHGGFTWTAGAWYEAGTPRLCDRGFHGSRAALDAFGYVKGAVIAQVEVRGESDVSDDKEAWSQMRLVDARLWTIRDSRELAIFSAELVLDIFESRRPGDTRPRDAIEAAKAYLRGDIDRAALIKTRTAAAAAAAYAAYAADANAAAYAADAAAAAADAAYAADANAAAYAAYAAAAAYAAYAADANAAAYAADASHVARAELKGRINDWIVARFDTLESVGERVAS